ncbi:MAG: chemotaxis protein CheW [Candidatus Eremiobacterota bacterium]
MPQAVGVNYLLCRAGRVLCALPLQHVRETMRPLPVEALAGTPEFVRGISILRGLPTPVVDLGVLLGGAALPSPSRWVTMKPQDRQVALCCDEVLGVRPLVRLDSLPPLLRDARPDLIERLGTLDEHLLLILRGASLIPEGELP